MPMSELERALRLERGLGGSSHPEAEAVAAHEDADLSAIASRLSAMDLSREIARPMALKARALERRGPVAAAGSARASALWRHRRGLLAAVLVLGVLVVLLTPSGLLKAAQQLYRKIWLSEGDVPWSVSVVYSPAPDPEILPYPEITCRGDLYQIRTSLGPLNGHVPEGGPACVETYWTIEDARERLTKPALLLPLDLRAPTYVPEGYRLDEIMVGPDDSTILFYRGAGPTIEVTEMVVGVHVEGRKQFTRTVSMGSSVPIEKVSVGGHPGAWLENDTLTWVADATCYCVGGRGLAREEALRIAESLE
jgi:hypothetical protein